jgi:hypothetical protein
MKILVACEYSGVVRESFRKKGHDAWSCDLLPCDDDSPYHYQCDIFEVINEGWDLMIAHPPCTYLCNSGVSWLYKDSERWKNLITGAMFFKKIMDAKIPMIAIENPIMHKYGKQIIEKNQSQIIHPWQFGHGETKATCLWLKNLPNLEPTNIVKGREQRLHKLPPSKDRWKIRSKTFQGIADAMAEQWTKYTDNYKDIWTAGEL